MLRSVALLNFGTRRARRSLSVRCKSAHATCKIQRSGRRYATWWIHISRVLNERSTAVLCAIAAQPSAAPQRRSIADRPTAIYGVKRLPGEAAWVQEQRPPPSVELKQRRRHLAWTERRKIAQRPLVDRRALARGRAQHLDGVARLPQLRR